MLMTNSNIGFSEKQLEILKFPYNSKGYEAVIGDGAIRSGKTSSMAIAFILWAMSNFNEADFIIGSKTVGTANRNIIRPIRRMTYFQEHFEINYVISRGYMTVKRGDVENYFYIFGGSTERSQDVVQGGTMSGAFLDEVALMPRSFVEQVIARCSEEEALLWFNCNPEHPTHWFKTEWIDKRKEKKVLYLHFTMEDNPSLSERVKERYRRRYAGVFYQRFILGLWTRAEGIIYKDFADNPEKFILDEIPSNWKFNKFNVGVDFGGNKSNTKFVAVGFFNNFKDVVVLKSTELSGDYTADTLQEEYQKFEAEVKEEYKLFFNAYCDSTEQILIRTLKMSARHSVIKNAYKGSIFERIKLVTSLMGLGRFWILRGRATDLEGALKEAVWDDKKENERLDDGTFDVDVLDATEYAIEPEMKTILHRLTY